MGHLQTDFKLLLFWLRFCLRIIPAGSEPVVKPKSEKDRLKELFPALCRADNPNTRVSGPRGCNSSSSSLFFFINEMKKALMITSFSHGPEHARRRWCKGCSWCYERAGDVLAQCQGYRIKKQQTEVWFSVDIYSDKNQSIFFCLCTVLSDIVFTREDLLLTEKHMA